MESQQYYHAKHAVTHAYNDMVNHRPTTLETSTERLTSEDLKNETLYLGKELEFALTIRKFRFFTRTQRVCRKQ